MARRERLGDILVRRGSIGSVELERAATEQGRFALPFASTLLRLGWLDEGALVTALSEQLGVPGVELSTTVVSTQVLGLVPHEVARAHKILPLGQKDRALQLATAAPESASVLDEIAFATGLEVLPYVAVRLALETAIEDAYAARRRGDAVWRGARATSAEPTISVRLAPRPEARAVVEVATPLPSVPSEEPLPMLDPVEILGAQGEVGPEGPARVLAVDDEPAILDLIDRALSHRGIQVFRATRGREALDMFKRLQPDLVLLDAMLPEIHGFEICSQIKGSEGFRHVPVIIISAVYTGWNFAADVKRLYGADDYLEKPFRVVELVRRVEEMLERTRARPRAADLQQASREAARESKRAAELLQQGQVPPAVEAGRRAVGADPFDARAHFILGSALQAQGAVYEAISEYERVVELTPGMFGALKNLAVLYERQGFRAKAVEMWTRALDHSPSDAVRQTIKAHLIGLL